MSVEELVEVEVAQEAKQYVCFVKRRTGHRFVPYTEPDNSDKVVVKSLREFLDHEISLFHKAGKDEKPENRPIQSVSLEEFRADIDVNGMNSKLVSMLGWSYPAAARIAESEGRVFLMTIHPKFPSFPYSFERVCNDDEYALHFVEMLLSLRGGEIGFEEYDPEQHVAGCQYGGLSAVSPFATSF
jgi:hypothetical protein